MKKTLLTVFATLSMIGGSYAQGDCDQTLYTDGYATYYTLLEDGSSSIVTCSFDAVTDIKGTFYGALHSGKLQEDNDAKYCGMCVQMTGDAGTEIVQVADECPTCTHSVNDIDLSPQAFEAIVGDLGIGLQNVSWEEVSCPWVDNLHVIVQGSNQWYAKVIIGNHINRIDNVEVQQGGSWVSMSRGPDNGWVNDGSINEISKSFRITDIYGEQIIVSGIDFSANPTNSKTDGGSNFMPCVGVYTGEVNPLDHVSVFPNPANNKIVLEGIETAETIEILNINGQTVGELYQTNGIGSLGVDISGLASGVYVVKMTGVNGNGIAKFIKK